MSDEKEITQEENDNIQYSFGAMPDEQDDRDFILCAAVPEELATLPQSVDISSNILVVKNQGQEGTCVANAGTEFKEFFDRTQLSVRYLYYRGREISGLPGPGTPNVNEGMVPRDMMKCLFDRGVCKESTWPYVEFDKGAPTPYMDQEAIPFRIKAYSRIVTLNDLKAHLANNRTPAVLTVPIYDNGINWYTQNVKANNNTVKVGGAKITSGHAILAVGYDDVRGAIKILNSWGTYWGEGGYAWIPYNYPWNDCWTGLDLDATYSYKYISQDSNPVITPGETVKVKLTLMNDGTADWTPGVFNIGTKNPQDRPSLFYNSDWKYINRAATVDKVVKPGETYDFFIPVTAPKNAKSGAKFKEYFCPVVDGLTWLKDIGIYTEITIE